MHPRVGIPREYAVRLMVELTREQLKQLKQGVELDDGVAKFDQARRDGGSGRNIWYRVTLHEGRNREIRRIFETLDISFIRLIRVRYEPVSRVKLHRGDSRPLPVEEIDALYDASKAGVKIDLIVRGICALRPGVPGLSENIYVRSIVGRFLEHSRVYCFLNGGNEEYYFSSADWMHRNLFGRNESCFEIRQKAMKEQIRHDLELFLADNCEAWILHGDGSYEQLSPGKKQRISAQDSFLETLATVSPATSPVVEFVVD